MPHGPVCVTALVYHKIIVRPHQRIAYMTAATHAVMYGVVEGEAMERVCSARVNNDNQLMGKV